MTARQPYQGEYRKLVLAFDVGTTYSGISYSVLDPGEVPVVRGVTRFPAQDDVGGSSKIPSIIYYDKTGDLRAVGAEALQEDVSLEAEDEGWDKVEWFKLHLRPMAMAGSQAIPPLPRNKTVIMVLADFLKYLFKCAGDFIKDTHATGTMLWKSVQGRIEFILSHPNGWEGSQQNQIRRAAVLAGLVPDTTDGQSKIHFVTEGEASLHFCVGNGLAKDAITTGQGFIIVDAGGGTIDLSAYSMKSSPNSFEEIAESACDFQGSVFVSRRARELLQEKLQGSRFQVDIEHIADCFDKTTKRTFKNDNSDCSYVAFGSRRDTDHSFGIRFGRLKLMRDEVEGLFEPSIQAMVRGIVEQRRIAQQPITTVFLVGGFAASDWVFSRLQLYLEPLGIEFCRPDSHINKAVADGAISYYIDHYVSVRVARFTYGSLVNRRYQKRNVQHRRRSHNVFTNLAGQERVSGGFSTILSKGTQVSESKEFQESYTKLFDDPQDYTSLSSDITCYKGLSKEPEWIDTEPDMFSALCTVTADTSGMVEILKPKRGLTGNQYYCLEYKVILSFGLTELKAQIAWTENGKEMRQVNFVAVITVVNTIDIYPGVLLPLCMILNEYGVGGCLHDQYIMDSALIDILSDSESPCPALNTPAGQTYLTHLTSLPLPALLAEPSALQTQSHHLTSSLTSLTHTSYPAFLSLHRTTTALSSSLSSLSSSLDSLISESLPKLDDSLGTWKDRTDEVLRERRRARVVLEQHDKIRDLLDIPLLIDTCVRNGYFAEALSLATHTASLSASSVPPPLLNSIRSEVHHSITQMLLSLLATLHEPNRKLPALWKAVSFLRRMDVFGAEEEIALTFLGGREACLKAALDGCGRDVQALIAAGGGENTVGSVELRGREREDVARYLKKYIDVWREGVYDIITQYTAIFLERSKPSSTPSKSPLPSPLPSASVPPSTATASALHKLLTAYASHALSTHLLPPLTSLLPLVPASHPSLLTQLTYCSTAFARVGMDFRGLLGGVFCDAVFKGVSREIREAGAQWAARVGEAKSGGAKGGGKAKASVPPSQWLITPALVSSPPVPPKQTAASPPHVPPSILASYPPLAEFTNALLGTFNGLRLLAPVALLPDLLEVLDGVLDEGGEDLTGYVKAARNAQGEERLGEEELIGRAAGEVYVKVFLPFVRRALVEGVYGVQSL